MEAERSKRFADRMRQDLGNKWIIRQRREGQRCRCWKHCRGPCFITLLPLGKLTHSKVFSLFSCRVLNDIHKTPSLFQGLEINKAHLKTDIKSHPSALFRVLIKGRRKRVLDTELQPSLSWIQSWRTSENNIRWEFCSWFKMLTGSNGIRTFAACAVKLSMSVVCERLVHI